ncbi:ABC transporter ATP-binding protein [Nonomuraea rosea]|uniref:ABC transporter ATP-binding protein n=1 Tax=Nonomuraea rosea TaxID=638574 RepID=A0ABP7A7L6_9ACTN
MRQLVAERSRLYALLPQAGPARLALILLLLGVSLAAAPLTALFASDVVDNLTAGTPVTAAAIAFATAMLARQATEVGARVVMGSAAKQIDGDVRAQVRELTLRPGGIAHLEDPAFHDLVAKASDQGASWRTRSAGTAAVGQLRLTARIAAAVAMAAVFAAHFPLTALALLVIALVVRTLVTRDWLLLQEEKDKRNPERRKVDYWAELALGADAAKEVRLFGLADWVSGRRLAAHHFWMADYWVLRRRILRGQWPAATLIAAGATLALAVPAMAALNDTLSVGELTSCLVAAWGLFSLAELNMEDVDIEYGKTAAAALGALARAVPERRPGIASEDRDTPLVRFENVSFTYPGLNRPVLDSLDLEIRPGERLAIVGVNGVGKTTLMKLLAGLYEPTTGTITADGTDLKELDPDSWRRRLTILFQDFLRYPLSARDNITLAAPQARLGDDRLLAILRRSGVDLDLDTQLWRTGTGGRDLSGGQWQKLALARVLYAVAAGRRLLILDEPTAHLDVRAEAEFHERVVAAAGEATVVLISHRLSTVRPADRIAVLDEGRVIEMGSHDTLMEAGGQYARLFRLQASRFAKAAS